MLYLTIMYAHVNLDHYNMHMSMSQEIARAQKMLMREKRMCLAHL